MLECNEVFITHMLLLGNRSLSVFINKQIIMHPTEYIFYTESFNSLLIY